LRPIEADIAKASARIENYLGFPAGISGQALTGRACVQAQKFGARVVIRARPLDLFHTIHTIWSDLVRRYFDIGQRSARLLTI
jgi:thioredoxin reductase